MTLRLPISLSLLLLALPAAFGQTADEFFHVGAQCYITNNIPKAKEDVAAGLKLYPDDIKLKKLDELLKQQQQQQQQNQQDQQNKDQQSKNDQQKQDKKDQQQQQNPDKPKEQKSEQQQARAAQAGQMTPQQAQRLLDTEKGEEQLLSFKPEGKPEDASKPVKDW